MKPNGSLKSEKKEKNEVMQKQLEALSFLDKRKATKPKLVTDQVPSVSGAPPSSDQLFLRSSKHQVTWPFFCKLHGFFLMHTCK